MGTDLDFTSHYYTYSTIAQTLAAAYAFLVAVVLYRVQAIEVTFEKRARTISQYLDLLKMYKSIDEYSFRELEGRWEAWVEAAERVGFKPDIDDTSRVRATGLLRRLSDDEANVKAIRHDLRCSLWWTGGTIASATVAIPITGAQLMPSLLNLALLFVVLAMFVWTLYCIARLAIVATR